MVWLVGALAFAMRLWSVLHSGGLDAVLGYDEGVYFGASAGLVNGLLPYRDFVLVHPPAILLILSPFAALGRWVGDPQAWAMARLFVMVIGAANAMMLVVIGRRAGRWAGGVAGLLYAVWVPAIHVERTTMLEAFVLFGMLAALLLLRTPRVSTSRLLMSGALLGVITTVKLWGAVPLLVIVGWLLFQRAWRSSAVVVVAAFGAAAVVVGPFLLAAPTQMVDLVLRAQMNRAQGGTGRGDRLQRIVGLANVDPRFATHESALITAAVVTLLALVAVLAWQRDEARLWVVLLVAQLAVLLAVPVFFAGYSSFAGPALVLSIGAAVETVRLRAAAASMGQGRWPTVVVAAGIGSVIAGSAVATITYETRDFENPARLAAAVSGAQCVASDSAAMLIVTNTMTRDLRRHCPVIFDVDGSIYAVNAGSNPTNLSSHARRHASTSYQGTLADYFAASDAVILHRAKADGLDAPLLAELNARPVLWEHGVNRLLGPSGASP